LKFPKNLAGVYTFHGHIKSKISSGLLSLFYAVQLSFLFRNIN
jgi:hypothetical protein